MTKPKHVTPEAFSALYQRLPNARIEASECGRFQFLVVGRSTVAVTELAPVAALDTAVGAS